MASVDPFVSGNAPTIVATCSSNGQRTNDEAGRLQRAERPGAVQGIPTTECGSGIMHAREKREPFTSAEAF